MFMLCLNSFVTVLFRVFSVYFVCGCFVFCSHKTFALFFHVSLMTFLTALILFSCTHTQMVVFRLEKCAAEALTGDTIECVDYDVHVPLSYLVPDLLLTDLPSELTIDTAQFEFNPKVCMCVSALRERKQKIQSQGEIER